VSLGLEGRDNRFVGKSRRRILKKKRGQIGQKSDRRIDEHPCSLSTRIAFHPGSFVFVLPSFPRSTFINRSPKSRRSQPQPDPNLCTPHASASHILSTRVPSSRTSNFPSHVLLSGTFILDAIHTTTKDRDYQLSAWCTKVQPLIESRWGYRRRLSRFLKLPADLATSHVKRFHFFI
jgi:hypothetical protein